MASLYRNRFGWAVALAVIVGLGLRIALGRSGIWLDEAWSVIMAHDVGGPLGVITGIHHDNNHPLNSWWLQLVGLSAPPLLMRTLSIACSTITIAVAARIAARRSEWAGMLAAFLFAVSPMLVLLGSEARGYAPMLLALVWIIDRLDRPPGDPTATARWPITLAAIAGTLGHFVMLPALFLLAAWQFFAVGGPFAQRLRATADRLAMPIAYSMVVIGVIIGMAWSAQGGLTIGSSTPFAWRGFGQGLGDAVTMTLGLSPWALIVVPLLLAATPHANRSDLALWTCLGFGLPLAAALLHPANSHIARYYLPSSIALLLLIAIRVADMRRLRWAGGLFAGAALVASLLLDVRLIAGQRGQPDQPVMLISGRNPEGATVLLSSDRMSAPIKVAAAQQRARIAIVGPQCGAADYLLIDVEDKAPPRSIVHCRRVWSLTDSRPASYRGAIGWALYQ